MTDEAKPYRLNHHDPDRNPTEVAPLTNGEYEALFIFSGLHYSEWIDVLGITYVHHRRLVNGDSVPGQVLNRHLLTLRRHFHAQAELTELRAQVARLDKRRKKEVQDEERGITRR